MESQARNGADPVAHEPAAVVVFNGRAQFPVLAVHIDVLTNGATALEIEFYSSRSSIEMISETLPRKQMGCRVYCHSGHSLRCLNC